MGPKVLVGVCLAVAALGSTACATLSHGVRQDVIVNSEPPGAQVSVNGKVLGVTPFVANFWRGRSGIVLRFELDGFELENVPLKRNPSAMLAVDAAVSLNPLAMQGMDSTSQYPAFVVTALAQTAGIDLLTGGAYKFPRVVTATLKRKP